VPISDGVFPGGVLAEHGLPPNWTPTPSTPEDIAPSAEAADVREVCFHEERRVKDKL